MSTYFYSHTKGNYRCFSNFYPVKFVDTDNVEYVNSEQYLMKEKARIMGDHETEVKIMKCTKPSDAKALGRKVSNFKPDLWDIHKYGVMVSALRHKFTQNPELAKVLRNTGSTTIAEASPIDKIWGIGLSESSAKKGVGWQGENLLGKALMQVRSEFPTA